MRVAQLGRLEQREILRYCTNDEVSKIFIYVTFS